MKDFIFGMNPYTFTGSAIVIGLYLVNELSPSEQASIGNWLQLIGLTIQTYASQVSNLETKNQEQQNNSTKKNQESMDLEKLRQIIDQIKQELDCLIESQKNSA